MKYSGRTAVTHIRKFLPAFLATLVLQPYAHATDAPAEKSLAAAVVAEEAQLDEGLKRFGYLAGLARGCVIDAQRVDLEREALDLHAAIARLLGTDRAFLFASSFGYGTNVVVETKDCADVLKAYDQSVAKFRAGRGEKK
jgi:hypothetical protein